MEITEINMISDFEAGMKCLQNPSFISRFSSLSGFEKIPRVYSFWKCCAVIVALFATFSSIFRKTIKLILFSAYKSNPSQQIFTHSVEDYEFSDDSSCSSSDDEDEEEECEDDSISSTTTLFRDQHQADEDFCVKGTGLCRKGQWQNDNLRYRRRQAWPEFHSGENVVKLWNSTNSGLNFVEDSDSKSVVSMWDFEENELERNFFGCGSDLPAVVLTAERSKNQDRVFLGGYDQRMRRSSPAMYAEWYFPAMAAVADGGDGSFDWVTGVLTIGDFRKLKAPLDNVTACNGHIRWEADGVTFKDELDCFSVN